MTDLDPALAQAFRSLGVSPDADPAAIRTAWRAMVRAYHPDQHRENITEANRRLAELNAAFDLVSAWTEADASAFRAAQARRRAAAERRAQEAARRKAQVRTAQAAAEARRRQAHAAARRVAEDQARQRAADLDQIEAAKRAARRDKTHRAGRAALTPQDRFRATLLVLRGPIARHDLGYV